MPVKNDGGNDQSLSFKDDIVAEFSDTAPHSMKEFYRGGNVPNFTAVDTNDGVPTSGQISFKEFYSTSARQSLSVTISSSTTNYNMSSNKPSGLSGFEASSDVTYTVNIGVVIGGTTVGTPAMQTGPSSAWPAGLTLTVVNNGTLIGKGGNGGNGASGNWTTVTTAATAGQDGGPAFKAERAMTFTNNGAVYGGGGGGGGGNKESATVTFKNSTNHTVYAGSGGGGGGGYGPPATSGGSAGTASTAGAPSPSGAVNGHSGAISQPGQTSSPWNGGAGGRTGSAILDPKGKGGSGGNRGAAGSTGGGSGGAGGAAGYYEIGNSFINSGSGIGGTTAGRSS